VDTQPKSMMNAEPAQTSDSAKALADPTEAIVPFNVLETTNWDLLAAFRGIFRADSFVRVRQALQSWSQQPHVFLAPSGECAIAQVLSLLPQKEVVMPGWICHQVKTAVRVAGKDIIFVDLKKKGMNATSAEYEEAAQPGRVLLIAHLFGVPTDVRAICDLAKRRECLTIEDAVPAIGGRENGRLLGTFADFGVFTFEQSKRLPAFRGGFITVNNPALIDLQKLELHRIVETTQAFPYVELAKAFVQNLATTSFVYRQITRRLLPLRSKRRPNVQNVPVSQPIPNRINKEQERLQKALVSPFYRKDMHRYQAELALRMIGRMDQIGEKISQLGEAYSKHFEGSGITTFLPAGCDKSGLMRFPIAFPGRSRSRILQLAAERGVHLKVLWSEEEDCEGLPNCIWAARNLILLPLYTSLSLKAASGIAQTLLEIEREVPAEESQTSG
jgi:dTDP-4-amino-4,6-dideoxygalactose transaminase